MSRINVLILGSKEYPLNSGRLDDPLPSGGYEVHISSIIDSLKDKDVKINLVTRRFRKTKKEEKKGNLHIYRVPWVKGFYLRNITFNLSAFFKSLSLQYDIILSKGVIASLMARLLCSIRRKKTIMMPGGTAFNQPQYGAMIRSILKNLERYTYSKSDLLIFMTESEKNRFFSNFPMKKDYEIIPKSVLWNSSENTDIKKEFGLEGKKIVLYVGRLIAVKGVKHLIMGAKELPKNTFVLIVGDGPEKMRLKKIAEKLHLSNVIFAGYRSDIQSIMKSCDVFVSPSFSEGFPSTIIEAMLSKIPIVATDIGLPLENNKDALLVLPGSAGKLTEAINRLLKNKKLAERLSAFAYKEACVKYDAYKIGDRYIAVIRALLDKDQMNKNKINKNNNRSSKNNKSSKSRGNYLTRIISTLFLLPAWFMPFSGLRVFFHRLRGVNIGRGVEIGYYCIIDNVYPHLIRIEDNVTITANCTLLAHDNSFHYTRGGEVKIAKTRISRDSFIGIGSIILPGVTIGRGSIIGCGSVVTKDVPSNSVFAGVPARKIKSI